MNQALLDTLGIVAGTLTTAAFLPQVVKTWKSQTAKDLSYRNGLATETPALFG